MENNSGIIHEGKLRNRNKHAARIEISISGKRNEIHIGKDVVRLLGTPAFLCMKVNKAMDSIAIMPCPGKEYMSFKVPEGILLGRHVSMRVVSQSFVDTIMAVNGLNNSRTYQVTGIYSEKNNAVIFNMSDIRLFSKDGE